MEDGNALDNCDEYQALLLGSLPSFILPNSITNPIYHACISFSSFLGY